MASCHLLLPLFVQKKKKKKKIRILRVIFFKGSILTILLLVRFGNFTYWVAWWEKDFAVRSQTIWKICPNYCMYD